MLRYFVSLFVLVTSLFRANAEYVSVNNITYRVDYENQTAVCTGGGYGDIVIGAPLSHSSGNINVIGIESEAFKNNSDITSVTIIGDVSKIGDGAFKQCKNLKSIIIKSPVKYMGKYTFEKCKILREAQLGDSLTSIEVKAFLECPITSITLPMALKCIEDSAFYACSSLAEINFNNKLERIGANVFWRCDLKNINLPESLEEIGEYAFAEGISPVFKSKLIIPSQVKIIRKGAFESYHFDYIQLSDGDSELTIEENNFNYPYPSHYSLYFGRDLSSKSILFNNDPYLSSVFIGKNIRTIPSHAFENCEHLNKVYYGESVTEIGDYAFANCPELNGVSFQKGEMDAVERIGHYAFTGTGNWALLEFPDNIKFIGAGAFSNCKEMKNILWPTTINVIPTECFHNVSCGYFTMKECDNELSLNALSMPETINYLFINRPVNKNNWHQFGTYYKTNYVYIGHGNKIIPKDAFINSTLKGVNISDEVESIEDNAFAMCHNLKEITIPNSVTTIGNTVFKDCSNLKKITLGNNVSQMGSLVFEKSNNIIEVQSLNENPPIINGFRPFSDSVYNKAVLSVPLGCYDKYQEAFGWKDFSSVKEITPIVTSLMLSDSCLTVEIGKSVNLSASVLPSYVGFGKDIIWRIEYNNNHSVSINSIDDNGTIIITPKVWCYPKEYTIVAQIDNADGSSIKAECKLNVISPKYTSLNINPSYVEGYQGDYLYAKIMPEYDNEHIKYNSYYDYDFNVISSDNEVIGHFYKENICITPRRIGKAFLTVSSSKYPDIVGTCEIVVKPVEDIRISQASYQIEVGESKSLPIIITPQEAQNIYLDWKSENNEIATVDYGYVTGISPGKVKVYATTTDGSDLEAMCEINVTPKIIVAESLSLNTLYATCQKGSLLQLKPIFSPDNVTTQNLKWSSENPYIASVDNSGIVTALEEGVTTITATTLDGSNLSATCEVSVYTVPVSNIILTHTYVTGIEDEQIQINATVIPEEATNKVISWSSSDESIATVDETGLVSLSKKQAQQK